MENSNIAHLRLYNQRIAGPKFAGPDEVVHWLGAVQAQDYLQALWAVGLRTRESTMADVERAIEERRIVRTWPMRGTLHFVPSEDAKWMLKLSASRMIARDRRRLEQLELDDDIIARCKKLFCKVLEGGKRLLRADMMRLLEDAGISTNGQRGYHILWYASQTGLICLGPMQGKQQTFVLLEEWVPDSVELSREESLARLAGRYFIGHGPATVHDFAWWASLTVTDAKAGLAAARPALISEKVNGKEYWMSQDAPGCIAYDESSVQLLPGFDEYLLGYKDRGAVLATEHGPRIVPGGNGVFLPTIVVGGQIVGTWKRRLRKDSAEVTLIPFSHSGDSAGSLIEAAEAYAAFIGLPLSVLPMEASHTTSLSRD